MVFFEELNKYLTEPFNEVLDYKYYVVSNKIIGVFGYKKIVNYSTNSINLSVKNNVLCIDGVDLKIRELDKSGIVIVGRINKVFLLNER